MPPTEPQNGESKTPSHHPVVRMALKIFRLALGTAILVYLYHSGMFKLSPLVRLLESWPISVAGIAILLVDIFIMGIRTCWMFEPAAMRLSIWKSFQLNLVASFFTSVIPGAAGGDVARIYYTTKGNPGN
ncbi:MAG TPA: lysylphosphatidylglycerol synthase domain-containing protein, partial [Candidatus Dormibacteraeota bacterium]|nr:lysylphosphatidylglycerol synthase domain-containing protein [Candidatus Dormibacteraeota bacterium]